MPHEGTERRESPRPRTAIGVRYRFLSGSVHGKVVDEVHDGRTANLSPGDFLAEQHIEA